MASLSAALRTLDDAITRVQRLRREADQAGNSELATTMRRLAGELEDVQTAVKRAKRDLE